MEKYFGISLKDAGMVFYRKGLMVNARTLDVVAVRDGEALVGEHGFGLWMGTRKIVHDALYKAAMRSEDEGEPVKIVYGADVIDYVSGIVLHIRRSVQSLQLSPGARN